MALYLITTVAVRLPDDDPQGTAERLMAAKRELAEMAGRMGHEIEVTSRIEARAATRGPKPGSKRKAGGPTLVPAA